MIEGLVFDSDEPSSICQRLRLAGKVDRKNQTYRVKMMEEGNSEAVPRLLPWWQMKKKMKFLRTRCETDGR